MAESSWTDGGALLILTLLGGPGHIPVFRGLVFLGVWFRVWVFGVEGLGFGLLGLRV